MARKRARCRERTTTEKRRYRWKATFRERVPRVFARAGQGLADAEAQPRMAELERRVGRRTMELDISLDTGVHPLGSD